eukprot:c16690_g1_i1 orf=1-327(-)
MQEKMEKVQEDLSSFKKETTSWADKVKQGTSPMSGDGTNGTPHYREIFSEMQERAKRALGVAIKGIKEVEGEDPLKLASSFFEKDLKFTPPISLSGAYRGGKIMEGKDR